METKDGENSGRGEDRGGRGNNKGSQEEIPSIPDGTGFSGEREEDHQTVSSSEEDRVGGAGSSTIKTTVESSIDIDQFVDAASQEVPVPSDLDELLVKLGKLAGETGYIFVGGLIPYKRADKGKAPWEIDIEKDPIRISNIEEIGKVRVSMALMAYLMESMQGDLASELGVGEVPGTEGQRPA